MTAAPIAKAREPRPIAKSAGGKTKLLPELLKLLPETFGHYYEPFIGGGALFFELCALERIASATLGDNNAELINLYEVVRESPSTLVGELSSCFYAYDKDSYYKIRALNPPDKIARAARFMYLNKTCFNGLWRVNKQGRFNVPMGRYKNPTICDEEAIFAASHALSGTALFVGDFEDILNVREPERGDVVYFDPPYDCDFTQYTAEDFTWTNQIRLYVRARYLAKNGVTVIASNADTARIRELWQGFDVVEVEAARSINSHAEKRGKIKELIFHN